MGKRQEGNLLFHMYDWYDKDSNTIIDDNKSV